MNAIRLGLGRLSLGAGIAAAALGMASATAQEITEFRIGILGGENEADRLRSNACLAERFEALLGVPVSLFPAADYAGVLEGLLGGTLDYAELGASGYAGIYLEDPEAVLPILTTRQVDGSTGYYSIMLARSDSDITSFEDMQGRVLGFADPNSTSGYLVPMVSFLNAGIDPDEYFAETRFSGGHEQNVLAVVNGEIDGSVTWVSGVGDFEDGSETHTVVVDIPDRGAQRAARGGPHRRPRLPAGDAGRRSGVLLLGHVRRVRQLCRGR